MLTQGWNFFFLTRTTTIYVQNLTLKKDTRDYPHPLDLTLFYSQTLCFTLTLWYTLTLCYTLTL